MSTLRQRWKKQGLITITGCHQKQQRWQRRWLIRNKALQTPDRGATAAIPFFHTAFCKLRRRHLFLHQVGGVNLWDTTSEFSGSVASVSLFHELGACPFFFVVCSFRRMLSKLLILCWVSCLY